MHIISRFFLILLLGVASAQDIKQRKISNKLNIIGLICGILCAAFDTALTVGEAVLGAIVALCIGIVCWLLKVFRAGDAKLLCAVGAFVGWKMSVNIFLFSLLAGAVAGVPCVILRLVRKEKGLTKFPFATAITAGTILGVHVGYLWEIIELI